MNRFGRSLVVGVFVAAMALGAYNVLVTPAQAGEKHPHIRSAIQACESAKHDLQTAAHDFKGHRVDAIKALDAAIQQLRICLEVDK